MRRFKYGRLPVKHSARSMRAEFLMAATLDPLGAPPPASNNYLAAVNVAWQMFGNDTLLDCTAADTAHTLMIRSANVGTIIVPTTEQVIGLYSATSGYVDGDPTTDNGAAELTVCNYLVSNGFVGHKADAVGTLDPQNQDHLRWCQQLFGSCRLGLNLPGYAEDQFEAGQTWDVSTTGDQSEAGHDVPLVDFRNGLFYVVSWGKLQAISPAAMYAWCEEAHCELYFDWIAAQGTAPSGFDLADLAGKMKAIMT
jgi:hypothetical protein